MRKRTDNVKYWPKERVQYVRDQHKRGRAIKYIAIELECDQRTIAALVRDVRLKGGEQRISARRYVPRENFDDLMVEIKALRRELEEVRKILTR